MPKRLLSILAIIIAVAVVGCVQPASDERAPEVASGPTFTPEPTETLAPTTAPTEEQTDTPQPQATNTERPTDTPEPTPTEAINPLLVATEVAQNDTLGLEQEVPDANVGGVEGQITDFNLTATSMIANATQTEAFIFTQTAESQGVGQPINTPTPAATVPSTTIDTAPQTSNVIPGQDCVHEVRRADGSLYRLSLAYGVTVGDIATASGIVNPDLIRIGQRLTIPGCGTTGGIPPATSTPGPVANAGTSTGGFTVPSTDCTYGTSVVFPNGCPDGSQVSANIATGGAANTAATTDTTGTGGITVTSGRTHTVAQGETLFQISLLYGVPVADIARANGISNFDLIDLNETLVIP